MFLININRQTQLIRNRASVSDRIAGLYNLQSNLQIYKNSFKMVNFVLKLSLLSAFYSYAISKKPNVSVLTSFNYKLQDNAILSVNLI